MSRLEKAWEKRGWLACLLWPISLIYCAVTIGRRIAYQQGWLAIHDVSLPVVVVGNISVGGTGKTPLCAYLVRFFQAAGWQPAIVSRGYGGERRLQPHLIGASDTPMMVGDEPLMLYQQTGVPVCVCVRRALAVEHIAAHTDADIVFADDGMQHLAMPRVAEVIVLDGKRGLGNAWMLPAGPLRERAARLGSASLLAVQSSGERHASLRKMMPASATVAMENNHFHLEPDSVIALSDGRTLPLSEFAGKPVMAMAGIGHPQRFFDALRQHGLQVTGIAKPDHHQYTLDDLAVESRRPLLVTAKDAVKLRSLGDLPLDVFEVTTSVVVSESLRRDVEALECWLRDNQRNG